MTDKVHPASPEARRHVVLGVVGGSGLYSMDALEAVESVDLDTPFGKPSGPYTVGQLAREGGPPLRAVFLPRHGVGHVLMPSEVNYRANVHGMKQLGVTHLLGISAVGSLEEKVEPGHLVLPDQFIDRTRGRVSSFFGDGVVAHIQFGDPTFAGLRGRVADAARKVGATLHEGGACIVMEGPAFSTRAESEMYRSWGASVIGMTALPEAKLAREAELGYAMMALSTDYDCWHTSEAEVSVEAVVEVLRANVELARQVVVEVARALPVATSELPYPRACENAILTARSRIPAATRERLDLIIGHYLES